jgi:Na+-transporting NADH:ubiquinone oxidoreductase subunit C
MNESEQSAQAPRPDEQPIVMQVGKPGTPSSNQAGGAVASWLSGIMARSNDSTAKTLLVTFMLCLLCSLLVSAAAVLLRPTQAANALLDRQRNIVQVAGLLEEGGDVREAFANVQPRIVDLETGQFTSQFDDSGFDQMLAARDPALSVALSKDDDIAGIGRRSRFAEVYLIGSGENFYKIVLPVHGLGLWSTLYGFVSLQSDLNTIAGLKFYQHAETPGLGGEVDNPAWQGKWPGKLAFNADGDVAIEVVKGVVDPASSSAAWQVDGLAGATLTSRGVSNLLQFWLAEQGFGPFIEKLKQREAS